MIDFAGIMEAYQASQRQKQALQALSSPESLYLLGQLTEEFRKIKDSIKDLRRQCDRDRDRAARLAHLRKIRAERGF